MSLVYDKFDKFKHKINITSTIYDAYKFYRKKFYNRRDDVSQLEYSKICQDFNKCISNKMITESFEFKIPFRLGYLRIKASKPSIKVKNGKLDTRKMAIDFNASKELWRELYPDKTWEEIYEIPNKQLIVHTNEHTDGYLYRWYWDKRTSYFNNVSLYKFKPVKGGKDDKYYSNDNPKYYGRLGIAAWVKGDNFNNIYYE